MRRRRSGPPRRAGAARASGVTRLESGTRHDVSTHVVMAVLLAALTVAAAAFVPLRFDLDSPDFNPAAFLPVLLGLAAGAEGVRAAVAWRRRRRFGVSVLELGGAEPCLGDELVGTIQVPTGLRPSGRYALLLQCVETVSVAAPGDSPSRRREHARWEARESLPVAGATAGVPVRFGLPATDPVTSSGLDRGDVRWVLEVRAPAPGLDYVAAFLLPVRRSARTKDPRRPTGAPERSRDRPSGGPPAGG